MNGGDAVGEHTMMKLSEVARALPGRLVGADVDIRGVTTDSRRIGAGDLFVALVGDRFDGHDYVTEALRRGAAAALVSREVKDATPFAQVLSQKLGVPFECIRLHQGDSDELTAGGGTGGSRSMYASGTAILEGADEVIKKGKQIAGFVLEASAGDIEFGNGRFTIAGTDRSIGIMELADRLRGLKLPEGVPNTLSVKHVTAEPIQSVFPNGCHVAEVEVDPDTGEIEVVSYNSVNDFGTIINPLLVAGQVHGGVVQGIGQALMEKTAYDADGQLLTGSYMDYAMPRAGDMPEIGFESLPIPAKNNPLGVKGCGEAGCAGALTSVMNAIADALSELGIDNIDMPATPERVWQAIQDAKTRHTL